MAHVCRLHDLNQQGREPRGRVAGGAASAPDVGGMRRALWPAALLARHHARFLPRSAAAAAVAAACSASLSAHGPACPQQISWQGALLCQRRKQQHAQLWDPLCRGGRRGIAMAATPEVSTAEAGYLPQQDQEEAPNGQQQQQQQDQQQQPQQQQVAQQQQPAAGAGGDAAAAAAAATQQGKAAARREPRYSPLHHNIEEFCRRVVPTQEERAAKQRIVEAVKASTRKGLEGMQLPDGARVKVQPFGSFVSGLSTWNSDVDIVVSGLVTPSRLTGGFGQADKRFVIKILDRVAKELRRSRRVDVRSLVIIRTARIPIIKLQTGYQSGSVVADVSLGDESGPAAARYVTQQIAAYPPLAPLVLVLKVYLRRCGLNEVANGGLSSYSLTLMVLAHLQEEIKAGNDVFDLGEALYSFLVRYGEEFDYGADAVSVASGGVVPKMALGGGSYYSMSSDSFDDDEGGGGGGRSARDRLMVDDPLTGRDISGGTYRVDDLRLAFGRAARRLETLAQKQRRDATTNYLQVCGVPGLGYFGGG
ncbi:poly(a) polymerase [Monoraphidium neglectum]|uniref:Poly(A) polymerase n=1 Tax=Monoraphidium neglectum TaxID=145388 RepID=A0A0D2J501_9CHLO|nr:poly(a) polymerase [Monoraphidium neglectum]KIY94997.1 poly(a) polymerase [Monoraphidium neglectum]|eukprot:XP_013894017.1 poly(a) polymerase [Monoraphidium neglectum]